MIYISVVHCQLCGKEIGPFRLLRDSEFCSSAHRKRYGQRLGKALHQLETPELVSRKSAGFQTRLPFQEGVQRSANGWTKFETGRHHAQIQRTWNVPLPPRLGTYFLKTADPSIMLPPPVLSCRLTEPTLLPAADIIKGAWLPPQAASGSLFLFTEQTMPSAWPAATARPAEACARLKMAWSDATRRMNLPGAVIAPADGLPAKETIDDGPLVAGPAPLQSRPSSRPAYPSIAAMLGARLAASMQVRLEDLAPASPAVRAAEPAHPSFAAQNRPSLILAADEPVVAPAREINPPALPRISARSTFGVADRVAATLSGESGSTIPVMSSPASRLHLRSLEMELAAERSIAELPKDFVLPACIRWMRVPPAETTERMVHAHVTLAWAPGLEIAAPKLDALTISPVQEPEASTCWMRVPSAEAAERFVKPAIANEICRPLAVAAPTIESLSIAPPREPEASTTLMAIPGAEAAERLISLSTAGAIATAQECIAPPLALDIDSRYMPISSRLMLPPAAEPVTSEIVTSCVDAFTRFTAEILLPSGMPGIKSASEGESVRPAASVAAPPAEAVESMPAIPDFVAAPVSVAPVVAVPLAQFPVRAAIGAASFQSVVPAAVRPEEQAPNARPARLEPISMLPVKLPGFQPVKARAAIPRPQLNPMEYYCHRIASSPTSHPACIARKIPPALAPFAMKPILERMDDLLKKPVRTAPATAKVVALPDSKLRPRNIAFERTAKIAAGLMMAAFLWMGARSINFNRLNDSNSTSIGSASDVSSATAAVRNTHTPAENTPAGPVARLRRAIAERASVETTDSFRTGMANWGFASKAWAPGWSHHPDGYVRPGELALFQPSIKYDDYRLEFYGQIESKSVGWVVRAADKHNYQAMKFTVIEPGIRPIIALVHYNVVGGKRGPRIQTPLNVMVHNNQPYHVAVDVRGNRFTTSIEGEQIGSWTDSTLASGGIGFFSEAGERARLYWMKVSKNQDWLGRICSYIAGSNSSSQTADLFRPSIPLPHREPAPAPLQSQSALAGAFNNFSSPSRVKTIKQQRTHSWNS